MKSKDKVGKIIFKTRLENICNELTEDFSNPCQSVGTKLSEDLPRITGIKFERRVFEGYSEKGVVMNSLVSRYFLFKYS